MVWFKTRIALLTSLLGIAPAWGQEAPQAEPETAATQKPTVKLQDWEREVLEKLELLENAEMLDQLDLLDDLPAIRQGGEKK